MREIIFRGIRKDTHEWVYGFYGEYFDGKRNVPCVSVVDTHVITGALCYEVIPETVGQYTGLKDKNGRQIFEGDIIVYGDANYVVCFDSASFGFMWQEYQGEKAFSYVIYFDNYENGLDIDEETNQIDIEVAGNIHDNPDLVDKN